MSVSSVSSPTAEERLDVEAGDGSSLVAARPKKYVVSPEWQARRRELMERSGAYPCEDLHPERYDKKLPEDGGWIVLLMEVQVGKRVDSQTIQHIDVPRFSAWFAIPTMTSDSMLHQAVIQTPQGAVHIWPHEYAIFPVERFLEFSDRDGFYTHFLSSFAGFDELKLFYLRSRGISQADAQRMLLATLKDPNYCYFTFDDALVSSFSEGAGMPYLMPVNHERRAAVRARREAAKRALEKGD